MKVKAYPKWVTFVLALSALGWIVMIIIDLVTKQNSERALLFYLHIGLAALYAVLTVIYAIQYGMSKHAKNKQLAAQDAAKLEAAKQEAVRQAAAQAAAAKEPEKPEAQGDA